MHRVFCFAPTLNLFLFTLYAACVTQSREADAFIGSISRFPASTTVVRQQEHFDRSTFAHTAIPAHAHHITSIIVLFTMIKRLAQEQRLFRSGSIVRATTSVGVPYGIVRFTTLTVATGTSKSCGSNLSDTFKSRFLQRVIPCSTLTDQLTDVGRFHFMMTALDIDRQGIV